MSITQKTKLVIATLILVSLTTCLTTPNYPTIDNGTLSDAQLVAIAKQGDCQPASNTSGAIIGVHNGVNVLENFTV